jgi:hypothetical protein
LRLEDSAIALSKAPYFENDPTLELYTTQSLILTAASFDQYQAGTLVYRLVFILVSKNQPENPDWYELR